MADDGGGCRSVLRSFVRTFPPLKIALYFNDLICYLFSKIIDAIVYLVGSSAKLTKYLIRQLYRPVYWLVGEFGSWLYGLLNKIPLVKRAAEERKEKAQYEHLKSTLEPHKGPLPHANRLIKRLFTYQGGLLLALFLYIFIYFVLVKNHTYITISIAFVFLLIYLILIENSHNLRSILMLCLPVMFTNRGRALVYCSMLAILAHGPIRTLQQNVREIHSSLTCCKQYLIVKGDKHVDENYVKRLVKVEEIVMDMVANIKQYARELKDKFDVIIKLAIASEQYIVDAIDKLKEIVNICNTHTDEVYKNCLMKTADLLAQCGMLFNPFRFSLCNMFENVNAVCHSIEAPEALCELPVQLIDYIERTLGEKLKEYIKVIERELHVDIDIDRKYFYNISQSKSYDLLAKEIKFDVDRKFWYVHFIQRAFNFLSLILVIWILSTGTVYHMHYLAELSYDNMYLDESLQELDEINKREGNNNKGRGKISKRRRQDDSSENRSSSSLDSADIQDLISLRSPPLQEETEINNNNNSVASNNQDSGLSVLGRNSLEEDRLLDQEESLSPFNSSSSAGGLSDQTSVDDSPDSLDSLDDASGSDTSTGEPIGRRTRAPVAPLEWRTLDSNDSLQPGIDPLDELGQRELEPATRDRSRSGRSKRENNGGSKRIVEDKGGGGVGVGQQGLFPLSKKHQKLYLKPYSLVMNTVEKSKLKWSSLVWLIIIGYITFFVLLDYAFYNLVQLLVNTLRDILFTSDLPLVDFETRSSVEGDTKSQKIVRYNRTYLSSLRKQRAKALQLDKPKTLTDSSNAGHSNSTIHAFYRRLMDSIERDIPDDVAILDSLEQCLPKPEVPIYADYKMLLYLALFTFGAVIVEAYALRTRHCIANLYYPRQARRRAVWLYRKMMSERHMYEDEEDLDVIRSKGSGGVASKENVAKANKKRRAASRAGGKENKAKSGVGRDTKQLALKLLTDLVKR